MIGDDEHGWDDEGVFNYEGGCYAKVINLDKESEPDIYNAIRRDALLEKQMVRPSQLAMESSRSLRVIFRKSEQRQSMILLIFGSSHNIVFSGKMYVRAGKMSIDAFTKN